MKKAGFEYLLAYKITVPIYDYTAVFCRRWIDPRSRTTDQMVQAARSGMQNLSEGYKQESLEGYIKLTGVTRGSLEELLKDYQAFARQNEIEIWDKDRVTREIGETRVIWDILKKNPFLPDNPNFPDLPRDKTLAVNLMISLVNQANFLIDHLIASLKLKFIQEGGFRENLFKKRMEYRKNN